MFVGTKCAISRVFAPGWNSYTNHICNSYLRCFWEGRHTILYQNFHTATWSVQNAWCKDTIAGWRISRHLSKEALAAEGRKDLSARRAYLFKKIFNSQYNLAIPFSFAYNCPSPWCLARNTGEWNPKNVMVVSRVASSRGAKEWKGPIVAGIERIRGSFSGGGTSDA